MSRPGSQIKAALAGECGFAILKQRNMVKNGGNRMADAKTPQQPSKSEKKIGKTTYIVTSHFQDTGSTAVDKIRCLLDTNTKTNIIRQKP